MGDGKMNYVSFRSTAFMDRCQVIDQIGINTPHLQQIDSYYHIVILPSSSVVCNNVNIRPYKC